MRKKSHILVARYLADHTDLVSLQEHRKALCLGSILPDLRPSFLTKKHSYDTTYEEIKEKIRAIVCSPTSYPLSDRVYFRRLGEILHYIADYFTYPHNTVFTGNLKDHCSYEEDLKNSLKAYIYSDKSIKHVKNKIKFKNVEEIFAYIEKQHKSYLVKSGEVETDIDYIMDVSLQVFVGIMEVFYQTMFEREMEVNFVY
ncbi:MAG TPA: zinc dependent phospholipase C family protein [Lachnospiraceae bacterium]